MLQRFYDLRNEIMTFLKQKNATFGINELGDPDWLTELVFLTDFMSRMNKLNLQLQGKEQFINRMYNYITALCKPVNSDKYVSVILFTKTQFESRFGDMKKQKDRFDLFALPFSVDVNFAPHELQPEIIELQSSKYIKGQV